MFQLNNQEFESLRSQIVTSNQKGGRRYLPYAFTEQGVAMLSAVLRSDRAINISIQIINAYKFVVDIIKSAKKSITLIDNYADETILYLFTKNADLDKIRIFTKLIKQDLKKDIEKYNSQYKNLEIYEFELSHDRFLIIDEEYIYHIGASIKDLGKKWFAFSKMDNKVINIVEKINDYLKYH